MKRTLYLTGVLTATMLLSLIVNVSNAQNSKKGNGSLPFSIAVSNKSAVSAAAPDTTYFGVLSVRPDINNRHTAANNLLVDYVRETQILARWNGTQNTYIDFWKTHLKKIVLNINNDTTPSAFPKGARLVTFENNLGSVLNVYGSSVELVVIENEELDRYDTADSQTKLYHFGSMQDYINELTVAVDSCKKKGVPVTNGGLTTPLVASLKHYYDTNGKPDSSLWLSQQMGGVSPDSTLWLRTDSLLNAYKTLQLSYVNLHWYEPLKSMNRMTGVLQVLCNYITQQTGKQVITNETGVKDTTPSFVTMLLQQWDSANVKYCLFFDGSGGFGAQSLTSATGVLLPTGVAFRDYIHGPSCGQTIIITPVGPLDICQGSSATLTASSGFSNYLWSNGATTRIISVNAQGNYSVTSNLGNCQAYSTTAVIVNLNALPPKPIITTNISPINVCPSKGVKLTSSPGITYLWNVGDSTTKSIMVYKAGSYTVTITDANGCANTSDPTVVTIQKCNAPTNLRVSGITSARATLSWDTVTCAIGYQYQYRIKGITAWTSVSVTGGSSASRTIYSLSPATIYQWRMLTACKITPDTITSNYANGPEFLTLSVLGAAKTLNADEHNAHAFDATVFPNPATNIASVSVSNISDELRIALTDLSGKVLWHSEKINDRNTNIPVANLARGTYIVMVKDKEHSKILKLVKE